VWLNRPEVGPGDRARYNNAVARKRESTVRPAGLSYDYAMSAGKGVGPGYLTGPCSNQLFDVHDAKSRRSSLR
jgi:hypothetical protein